MLTGVHSVQGVEAVTLYGVLMSLGGLILADIIVKGFWSGDRVKSIEQPDDWQKHNVGGGPPGGS
jgi:hypothetical protein